jgi:Zn-finger nucleic acid-binding protein
MEAETLNCPMCGASVASDSPQCRYCEARLATVACPSCFAMIFVGSKHCPRCGAAAAKPKAVTSVDKKCPRCKADFQLKSLADETLLECPDCLGLWLDVATFDRICAEREQHAAVLGAVSLTSSPPVPSKVSYVPCPECKQLMNRANFARCSGVIVDLCKKHGIWFDRDELSGIIEFIREGGLDAARAKEKAQLDEERRRLEQLKSEVQPSEVSRFFDNEKRVMGIASARGLLKFLLK